MNDVLPASRGESDSQSSTALLPQAELLSRLAHELRNPLAPIRMALQIMQVSEGDIATVKAARVIIDRQLNQLTRLIEDLADISHLEQGALRLQLEPTTVKAIVDRALLLARPQLESRQNAVRVELAEPDTPVVADAARLAQALANVLVNASKYSAAGSAVTLSAAVGARAAAREIAISIEDAGVGIPRAMLTRVFEPFVQVNRNGTGTHDGLGIGLAIVRSIVHAHGGIVQAESEGENRGTRVTLKVPLRQGAQAAPLVSLPADDGAGKLRILIADDNRDAAQMLAMMLAYDGHEVRTAYDGLEVLATGQMFNPDLIVLDIGMPVLDGYQTARQIRERPWGKSVHLVALTGWGQETDRERAFAQGFQHHIVKPGSPEKLAAVIEAVRRSAGQ